MDILGIGLPELVLIMIVVLIIMGPKDMEKAGRTIGKFLRKVITSDGWKMFQQTSREIRTLPHRLMREANEELQQVEKTVNQSINNPLREFSQPARSQPAPTKESPAAIATPKDESDPEKNA